jgi:hypothetical protein
MYTSLLGCIHAALPARPVVRHSCLPWIDFLGRQECLPHDRSLAKKKSFQPSAISHQPDGRYRCADPCFWLSTLGPQPVPIPVKVRKIAWGSFAHLRKFPWHSRQPFREPTAGNRITPQTPRILSHPRGEIGTISPHRLARTKGRITTCGHRVGRNPPLTPHEKKKKFC